MKIVFAIKRLDRAVGGAERVLCMVASELSRRGHDITVVTCDSNQSTPFYPIHDGIRIINLSVGETAEPGRFVVTLTRIIALRRAIIRINPDVVVGFMHSIFIPLSFALVGANIPLVASEHIVPDHYRSRPLQFALLWISAFNIQRITVLSENIKRSYPKLLRDRMHVLRNPVLPVDNYANPGRLKDSYILLNIGRLDNQKDQKTLINAFALIAHSFPNWILRIYGDGTLRDSLEGLIIHLGLVDQVFLLGNTSLISEEYAKADIFCLSSLYEAYPLVVVEAQSHGLPVVAFENCPGVNELVINRKNGLLVESSYNRSQSLAKSLSQLMCDSTLRYEYGSASRKATHQYSSLCDIANHWETLLTPLTTSSI